MRRWSTLSLALAVMLGATGAAHAVGTNLYTSLVVLGDSLSDPGNLYRLTGGRAPENPPYKNGRYTNGKVWAETLGQKFEDKGLAVRNFAYGGANAVSNGDFIPDLEAQREMVMGVSAADLGRRAMVSIFIGSNDGFGAITSGANIAATARAAARSIGANATYLFKNKNITNFSFINSPSLNLTPRYRFSADTAKAAEYTSVFNTAIAAEAASLRALGMNVLDIDINTPFTAAVLDPTLIGLQPGSSLVPCIIPGVYVCDQFDDSAADKLLFYDPVHPNSAGHAAIADLVSGYIAPVPLPMPITLLIVGMGGLLIVSRRPTLKPVPIT